VRFLVRALPWVPEREDALYAIRSIAADLGSRVVNPKWTSHGALEVDVFSPSHQDFELFMAAVSPLAKIEFAKDLQEPPVFLPKERAIEEAVALFNGERFWEAHEVLESKWRVEEGDEKRLLQGLILVCAAFVHHQKGEEAVSIGISKRALPLLRWSDPTYFGIEVASLRGRLSRMVDEGALEEFELSRRPGD
jgi:hypothetical protein